MAKKSKNMCTRGTLGIILGIAAIAAVGASFFYAENKLNARLGELYEATGYSSWNMLYRQTAVSDDGKWFMLPEVKLKFPYSDAVSYQKHGVQPKYRLTTWCGDDSDRKCWEMHFTFSDSDKNNELHYFDPVVILHDTKVNYAVGDKHSSASTVVNGKDVTIPQVVSEVVTLPNGQKFYILTYDTDSQLDDYGNYRYQDLVDALKQAQPY